MVGGTGLYFKSLTQGLADIPDIPENLRDGLRARLDSEGLSVLYAELQRVDSALDRARDGKMAIEIPGLDPD